MTDQFAKDYRKAKSNYRNSQSHLASVETQFRQQAKKVDSLRRQLSVEESILRHKAEKYEQAKETLKKNRDVYKPLKQQWILLNPKGASKSA